MIDPFRYKPHWPHQTIDEARCRAAVADGGRSVGFHQCRRKPTSGEWCKQHDPVRLAAKRQAEIEEWKRADAARAERSKREAVEREHAARVAELERAVVEAALAWHADVDESYPVCKALEAAVDALLHERARGGTVKP